MTLLAMVSIIVVTEDDWSAWKSLRLRALQEAPYAFRSTYDDWKDAPEERWRQRFRNPESLEIVADRNGSLVGLAGGTPGERPRTVELVSMWVEPSARGTGIVDALIAAVERWASIRAAELWLAVMPTNGRAIAAYSRHGFTRVNEPGEPLRDGSGHEILMKKSLGG